MTFTACYCGQWAFRAFTARLTGCQPSSRLVLNLRSSHVSAGVYAFRPFYRLHCLNGRSKNLYALYASKNRLCMLCENTTPKKTAYNAYRNEKRRVRRAEGTKMYALKDAYKAHTKCIQAYKKSKKRGFFFLLLLTLSVLLSLLPAISGIHGPHRSHCPFF